MRENNQWLSCYKPNPKAKLRLFCFPYAGGGSSIFRTWAGELPTWTEICPVQLPGRENRIQEKPFKEMEQIVTATVTALAPYFDLPFMFFGHSMGALIAYEIACYLRKHNNLMPKHLFVSGRFAPHIPDLERLHLLPDKEFKEEIGKYNGTPSAVLENGEIMQLIMPILRADFSVCETYLYNAREPLECPISAFTGKDDHMVDQEGLYAWQQHTTSKFRVEIFPGDHFFLRNFQRDLLKSIVADLEKYEK
jgi:medium-chain acyl-[acyl-carrier-protein] hydrolase